MSSSSGVCAGSVHKSEMAAEGPSHIAEPAIPTGENMYNAPYKLGVVEYVHKDIF